MAGALSYIGAGMAEGFGRGMAGYGVNLMQQADAKALRDQQLQDRLRLEDERQKDRLELAAARGAGGAGGAAKDPISRLQELGEMMLSGKATGALMAGGMDPTSARDASAIASGSTPMQDVGLDSPDRRPDRIDDLAASGQTSAKAPKYTPGSAAQLMVSASQALRRAMGIVNPEAADNVATAEQTEWRTGALKRYEQGDVASGRAALAAAGKTTFGNSGDELTGAVPKGSVAESVVRENNAQAGMASAHAGKYKAETEKIVSEAKGALADGASKERLATMLNSLNSYAKDMDLTDAQRAEINALRQQITRAMQGNVANRAAPAGGAATAKPDPAAALQQARAAIARGASRDAVIARLKGMGIDPKGL